MSDEMVPDLQHLGAKAKGDKQPAFLPILITDVPLQVLTGTMFEMEIIAATL